MSERNNTFKMDESSTKYSGSRGGSIGGSRGGGRGGSRGGGGQYGMSREQSHDIKPPSLEEQLQHFKETLPEQFRKKN